MDALRGPTLLDLAELAQVDVSKVSYIFPAFSCGSIAGSLASKKFGLLITHKLFLHFLLNFQTSWLLLRPLPPPPPPPLLPVPPGDVSLHRRPGIGAGVAGDDLRILSLSGREKKSTKTRIPAHIFFSLLIQNPIYRAPPSARWTPAGPCCASPFGPTAAGTPSSTPSTLPTRWGRSWRQCWQRHSSGEEEEEEETIQMPSAMLLTRIRVTSLRQIQREPGGYATFSLLLANILIISCCFFSTACRFSSASPVESAWLSSWHSPPST